MASAQSLGSNRTRKPLPARALPMGRFLLYCRGMPRSLKRADYVCPVCNGRGRVPGRLPGRDRLCDECHGTGRITPIRREVLLKKMKEGARSQCSKTTNLTLFGLFFFHASAHLTDHRGRYAPDLPMIFLCRRTMNASGFQTRVSLKQLSPQPDGRLNAFEASRTRAYNPFRSCTNLKDSMF
jgi:hypothetical protein